MDNHVGDNHLIVLFLIHHTSDDAIIDEILVDCLNVLKDLEEATLGKEETSKFEQASAAIPKSILSEKSVEAERRRFREIRDLHEWNGDDEGPNDDEAKEGQLRELYKMSRSIDVLGQVLRNKYGILQKDKIEDVIETIVDGGLRSISAVLNSQDRIDEAAIYLSEKYPDVEKKEVRRLLSTFLLLWTFANLSLVAGAVSVPSIIEAVNLVVQEEIPQLMI